MNPGRTVGKEVVGGIVLGWQLWVLRQLFCGSGSIALDLHHLMSVMQVDSGILLTIHPNSKPEYTIVSSAKLVPFHSDIFTHNINIVDNSLVTLTNRGQGLLSNSLIEARGTVDVGVCVTSYFNVKFL